MSLIFTNYLLLVLVAFGVESIALIAVGVILVFAFVGAILFIPEQRKKTREWM